MAIFRSFLFAPGNHARRVEKVFTIGADGVILDLEDAVAVAEKPATRQLIVAALQRPRNCLGYVRVNAIDTPFCYGDLVEVIGPGLDGIILPKVESASGLLAIDWLVEQLERERGLPRRSIDIIPIIETARGIANLAQIMGAGSRVRRCSFGAGDFTFDANVTWTRDEAEMAHARAQMVIQSRANGLEAPLDSVWVDLQDAEGLEASARAVKRMGFQGKTCIHPSQIPVVNAVFSPTEAELAFARKVVDAFEAAEAAGSAAFQIDGKFVDYPIVYRAQRIVKEHEAIVAAGR
ncbi:citrate lyase [Allostella vacuolata]|nr:citrate lyase [Stella vacuolata]